MEMTNEWIEEGVLKGLEKGRREGRDLVLRQLRRKLGAIPAKLAKQLDRLDDAAIFALGDALFDFSTPADAQKWLAKRR